VNLSDETEFAYRPEAVAQKSQQFIVLTGCSGGGKSSLLAELSRRGFVTYAEPGRQVVKEQLLIGGDALPWANADLFLELTISRSIHNLVEASRSNRIAFFDRGIVDQISGYENRGMQIPEHLRAAANCFRYRETVFVVPPWQEIYVTDTERRHSFAEALSMYAALVSTYEEFDYRLVTVPKVSVAARAEFVIRNLRMHG
jgi:predicted ATPase